MPQTQTARPSAREAMEQRTRVSFGRAYFDALLEGRQRDFQKHLALAVALGVATAGRAKRMKPDVLVERLVETVKATPAEQLPRNAKCVH